MIINIDNYITNSGSEYQFQKWLEKLSKNKEFLPEDLLFLAFDNKQGGQKNYLDWGFNTHTNLPWALNRSQYEKLFDISPQMQKVFDEELYDFLTDIFNLLVEEKLASNNIIDSLISSIGTNIIYMKICSSCNRQNIENQKRKCPECRMRLPILAEMQKEEVIEDNITNKLIHSLVFKPYSITNEQNITSVPKISYTQQVIDPRVNVPKIYIPNPININPNSIANVKEVLSYIEIISEKFSWLVLIPEQLYEEMNMLRAFVELNWKIDIKRFAKCQRYRTENQLAYFKKCANHHKSWNSICNIYRRAISIELMWPYIKNNSDLSVERYIF
ncbi:hypothetical protein F8M41_019631 [Gigaspora margarita]|uniref:Uncharacterized protein n=1 Tax=Gigaspora margarita TaxID=4874 RepID=A0A8H4EKC8_GIGMA|nr:hypothetical protein F8M41_019631 [Gigaspora margarita]